MPTKYLNLFYISLLLLLLESCVTNVPLVVNSPAAANTNVIDKKQQIAGTVAYTTNSSVDKEGKTKSNAMQVDGRYSITNKLFVEGQFIVQREVGNKPILAINIQRDTLSFKKEYSNKGYSFGAGYYTSLDATKNNAFYYGSVGYNKHCFNVKNYESIDSTKIMDKISFAQKTFYINNSIQINGKNFYYTLGLYYGFTTFKVMDTGSNRLWKDINALGNLNNKITPTIQLYNAFLFTPYTFPLGIKATLGINRCWLPDALKSRWLTGSIGLCYVPTFHKK